jgi:uncharacterized membrane protein
MNSTALNPTALALPDLLLMAGWAGLAVFAWGWMMSGDWRRLAEPAKLNLFLGATVAILALWQIKTGVKPGLAFHLYGIAALTLMFGFWRAVGAGVLVLVANAAFGKGTWPTLGFDAMMMAVLPAAVSWNLFRVLDRRLANHFFIYVLGNGFAGGWLSVAAIGLATTLIMAASGAYTTEYLFTHYTPYATLLISWGEAFMSGMAVTVMAVYKPHWLETFDDARYLQDK